MIKRIFTLILIWLGFSILVITIFKFNVTIYMIGYFVIFSIIRINLPLKLNRLFYINLLIFNIVFFLIYIVERFYIENNIININN